MYSFFIQSRALANHRVKVEEFIRDNEIEILVVQHPSNDKITCSLELPKQIKKKALYFLKSKEVIDHLSIETMKNEVVVNELTPAHLENLKLLSQEVYFPLLSNPANRAGWSGPTSKEVMLKFSSYLSNLTMTVGQSKGQTLLPHPPPEAFDEDNLPDKERVHLLETSVVQWSNKMQTVLMTDPETLMKQGGHPDPMVEVQFWASKAKDLNSLHDQLVSPKMRAVISTLSDMKSPLAAQFEKLANQVLVAREEAAENTRFLRTLKKYFQNLRNESDVFRLEPQFLPMMHTILLVWQHSTTYNTKPRLTVLIQEICNALITQTSRHISGENIFRFIDDENVPEAVSILKQIIQLCNKFKHCFARYKARASKVLRAGAWEVPEDILFVRLNAFLERCHDILEFTKIVLEFSKLEKIFIGGTKGKQLTEAIRQIHNDFKRSVQNFKNVAYDIMDITRPEFDDDFYRYRCQVKELEHRLSAVLTNGFDDASTIYARFKLLDSFEGLLERPIIKDELDKKENFLLTSYMVDLRRVQEAFHRFKANPPIDNNLPPVAGALSWCRGLLDRVREPMDKLRQFTSNSNREEAKEIEKVHNAIIQQLQEYEAHQIEAWAQEIDLTSETKLQQFLLRREKDSRKLHVNFDDALVRLLREVKYFLILGLDVPPTALSIYERAEQYRKQIGSLELIVQMYNEMMETLHAVEKPLVEKEIAHIDETTQAGIEELNWRSPEVDSFIDESMKTVQVVYDTVKIMKKNMETIKKIMADYASKPLADRKNKPLSPADFEENLRKLWDERHEIIRVHQETVTKLLIETNEALKVSKGSPIWRAYVEYVQDSVRDGLATTIVNSIKFICDQLDQQNIEKNNLPQLLEIKLGLYANDVLFNAEDGSVSTGLDDNAPRKSRRDVWQIVNDWVEGFFEIGNIMTRNDGSHYVGDLKKNETIVRFINALKKHLDWNQKECDNYRSEYIKFEFLWKTDRDIEFQRFLNNVMAPAEEKKAFVDEVDERENNPDEYDDDDDDDLPEEVHEKIDILPLDEFEKKILYYKALQAEIAEKKDSVEIGWLKVNANPIKLTLQTWVTKWIHTYTSFLYNDVTRKLTQLDNLMKNVNEGLMQEVPQGDSEALKKVLGHIHQVRSKEKSTVKMFQPLKDTVNLLKKHGRNLDEFETKLLSEAPSKWDSTVTSVYAVKEKVNKRQDEEVDKIKEKVKEFEEELTAFRVEFQEEAPFQYDIPVADAYESIYEYHGKINEVEQKAARLTDLEKVFELNVSKHRQIKKNRQENRLLKQCWDMVSCVKHQFDDWKKTLWDKIDTDVLLRECKNILEQIEGMPSETRNWPVQVGLTKEVNNLLTVLPLVNLLHSPAMKERHWNELKVSTKRQFIKGPTFCLADLLALELHLFVDDVKYIVELAQKEAKIALQLQKIATIWATEELEFGLHKKGVVPIIKMQADILITLEENMAALQGMQGQGKYVEHFIDDVALWQKKLGTAEAVLYDWLEVQRKWSSLESIFLGSQDIQVQLPEDSKRFGVIDGQWQQLMLSAKDTPNVIDATSPPDRSDLLVSMKVGLEQCEKSLFQYLETKRKIFPRFYFLSPPALLDILANGYNPQAVEKHLGDCFDNIQSIEFEKDADGNETKVAIGMYSKDGDEYVPFPSPFVCEGAVEQWLNGLCDMMKETLRDIMAKAKFSADHWEIDRPRQAWLYDFPAQVALTVSQIIWTEEVFTQFDALADGNEQALKEYSSKTLALRLESLIKLVQSDLEPSVRTKIMTLITVDVHNRDTVQSLIDDKILDAGAFAWQKHLRYSWVPETRGVDISIADAEFKYSYEYVGNTGRLVITPLTDRCYITLTQALRLMMGGAPAGPAGTGKTETTKDLGRAMGLPVYVFNCSEQMNVHSMSAIYKGLAQTGAWGCFDEFNRIPIEVLSVVSTQVSSVLEALRENKPEFDFMGEMIKLNPTVGMFITMNPGYAGRTELPENLKALFRSCAMVVPDMELICENMLMSEGFLQANRLSKKFTTLYSRSSELLSKQRHYDWGLRACKAVLRVAGSLKRAEKKTNEDQILMRALRDFNMPKLVDDDKPIFKKLIQDLFPSLKNVKRKSEPKLIDAIKEECINLGLQPSGGDVEFTQKVSELAELMEIRHSVFIIGPAGSGKSKLWRTLCNANNSLGKTTTFETINPKAITNNELYGFYEKNDWVEGILSTVMRNMSRNLPPYNPNQAFKWIVLDGDIDPNWIESLNTVMDDNKVLTLVSAERIPFTKPMRLVFEIGNLDHATPATVSRAGIIFINAKDVGWKPYLDSWIEERGIDNEKQSFLEALCNKYTTSEYISEMNSLFKPIVPLGEINFVKCLCQLLDGLLKRGKDYRRMLHTPVETKMDSATEKELFEANFVFASIWAFGGALMTDYKRDYRTEFSDWWKRVFTSIKFPKEGTVFDYYPDPTTGKFVPWAEAIPEFDPPHDAYLVTKLFVPTKETICIDAVMDLLVEHQRPVLLVGTAGTGKTSIIKNYFKGLDDKMSYCTINLNYYTDAKALQRIMESYIDKRSGRAYGPPPTKKLIYFIDDLNMPFVDEYGTQSPSALIRQQMDYGTWYDTAKLEKKDIQDVQYLCCMNPTAGSFTINSRLLGQFSTFCITLPSTQALINIYSAILSNHLSSFPKNIREMCGVLVKQTLDIHSSVALKFIPSTKKFHYQFNLRDLSNIFQGLCQSQPRCGYTPKIMVKLWQHECSRVIGDRLISPQDEAEFNEMVSAQCKKNFRAILEPPHEMSKKLAKEQENVKVEEVPNIFTSFHDELRHNHVYYPISDVKTLKATLNKQLTLYNSSNAVMDLELFGMAMGHVCRIVRIIQNPRGNATLVGVGGSGKQSLAKLAAFICNYEVFQISVSQSYGLADLKGELQELYRKAGVKKVPVMFLLNDSQVVDDTWLVYINDLLSSGYIPDLFTKEDLEGIYAMLRNEAKQHGVPDVPQAMQEFFINNVRASLHMVLCFSPVGDQFRKRCRKFPGLINCTSIDWFHPWPRDALESVGYRFLDDVEVGDDDTRWALAKHMAEVHMSVDDASDVYRRVERRHNYTTPKSYLELIAFFKRLLKKKKLDLYKQTSRLSKGIATLKSTHADVSRLNELLTENLVRVGEKAEAATVLIKKMGVERKKVTEQQEVAAIEAKKAKAVSEVANRISEECKQELARSIPIMKAAKDAVKCLSKPSLGSLKSFPNPPVNVLFVTKAVLIMKEVKGSHDWVGAKKMMKNIPGFIAELETFDARTIEPETLKKLEPILAKPFFTEEKMKSVSTAAANLCKWVINIVGYHKIYKEVKPKIDNQKKAAEEYDVAQAKLRLVEERVALMQQRLKSVTDALRKATEDKNQVEAEAQDCKDRLFLAKRLVDGLADENERWTKGIEDLKAKEVTLVGDVMLSASFVSYLGAFNAKFRRDLWESKWISDLGAKEIKLSPDLDPLRVLANDSDFAKWKNEGLAADRMSLENGAIFNECYRWPLLIDPQLQGVKWIKNRYRDLKVIQLNQRSWVPKVIDAVTNGYTILVENAPEEMDPTLNPLLSRQLVRRGVEKFIKLGGDEVAYDDNFRLLIQTKLANPHYKPEIAAQCTLLNFIVTEVGLEDQLLALVVNKEKPELEEKRTALVRAINDYMVSLTDLENELLERLSTAPADILSDVSLIESLEKTKQASTDIETKVQLAKKQEISINAARNEYRGVAAEGSWLYFLLNQMVIIDHMYQFSLDAFTSFFNKAMSRAEKADTTEDRVNNLRQTIRLTIFTWVNRGLFEKHKLIFSSQLTFKLMMKGALKEKFNAAHFDYLIRGDKITDNESKLDWLPDSSWHSIQALSKLQGFEKFGSDIEQSPNQFKGWYDKSRPETSPLPLEWRKLDEKQPFMKLLIIRAMRQDRLTTAMENFVKRSLPNGKAFVECDAGKAALEVLSASLDDSTPENPIFFILSPGSDPVANVLTLAKKHGLNNGKLHRVALGEGMDVVAMNRLQEGHTEGHWVVLENIHLMPSWCIDLEKKMDEFAAEVSHPDFRVFLSAEPAQNIPIGILERSIKLTSEPPRGLKQNVTRAFATFDKDDFNYKDSKVKAILFGLCHFHSVIIERMKFGAKGWNRNYPFNTGDLMDSSTVLMNYMDSGNASNKVPWSDLRYIFGEILYGGHITDDRDRLLCNTYLDFYMREELLDEMELFPFNESYPDERFLSPPALVYDQYFEYIEHELEFETPVAFGMHPNAEIAVKTEQGESLFKAIIELQPRTNNENTGEAKSEHDRVTEQVTSIKEKVKGTFFNLDDIHAVVVDERGPYQYVFFQECERMNIVCKEILRSLEELDAGLNGELQMSNKMEYLQRCLFLGRVPESWSKLAYPSLRKLGPWVEDLMARALQLSNWTDDPTNIPLVVQLNYLFNPQSFLTAIMQCHANSNKLELDKLSIQTDVTRKTFEQTDNKARHGAYVTGLYMEGARWNWTTTSIEESAAREMYDPMPVIQCRAILQEKREHNGLYQCPVYRTQRRGPTFIFTAGLRSKVTPAKWILAGVVLVMEVIH